jgi:hypothetical protein
VLHFIFEAALDISSEKNKEILSEMFKMKKVPLEFLGLMENYRNFHKADFPSVIATVRPEVKLRNFDFYFDFTLALVQDLKPLWNI